MGVEYTGSAPITSTQDVGTSKVQYTGSAPIQDSSHQTPSNGSTPVYNSTLDAHISVPNAVNNGSIESSKGFNFWDSIVGTGKKVINFFTPSISPETQKLKDQAQKESDDWRKNGGEDPNYTNAVTAKNKTTVADKLKELEPSKNQSTLKLDPFNTLLTANKTLTPYGSLAGQGQDASAYNQTSEDLKQLGYQYVTNTETGQQELMPVSPPSISPDQIASKRTSLNGQFNDKIAQLSSQLNENRDLNAPPTKNTDLDEPQLEGNPVMTEDQRKQVTDQLIAIKKAKDDANALYAAVQIKQLELGSNPNFQTSSTYLQDHAKDKNLNLNDYAQKLTESIPEIEGKSQRDPKAVRDDLITKGMYLEFGGDMPSLNAARAIIQSGNTDNKIPKWKVDQWALAGATMDARSVAESLESDKKIKDQIDTKYRKSIVDQIVKQNPTASQEQIDQILDKVGVNSASQALGQYIQAKQGVVDGVKTTTKGGLNYLIIYENAQKNLDQLYERFPIVNLAYIPAKSLNDLTHLPSNAINMLAGLGDNHIASEFEKHMPEAVANVPRYEETLPDGNKVMLPITQKPINFFGRDHSVNNPKNWNWDVFGGQAIKMGLDLVLLKGAGEIVGVGTKALYGEGLENLRLGAELQKASPELESQLGKLPISYQTGYNLANAGNKILVGSLGQATPAMLLWGPDNIKAEMDKKNITVAQATKLGLLRSAVEGLIYSESPTELATASERLVKGEIDNAFEHEAYKQLVERNWPLWTGKSISNKVLRFIMDNGSAVIEGYSKSATDLVIQQNAALIANHAISEVVRNTNPDYLDPEHDLTRENILNATITALGTAVPFGLMHAKGIKDQTEYSRTSALFHMANAPEWYKYHIKDRLDNGEISENEALRQQHIIDQASAINTGLGPKFAEIQQDEALTDSEKHKQKLDLFMNRTRQVGILNEISNLEHETIDEGTGKVTTERERLLQRLTDVNKEYQEMLDLKEARKNLSEDDKNLEEFNRFWNDNRHLFQNLDKLSVHELDQRRSVLNDLLQKETNPYISSNMYSMMRDMEIRMSDNGYRRNITEHRDEQLQDLIPKVQDLAQRGHEEYDGHVRKGTHDEENRGAFVKQFVEDNLDPWEMKNYRDLENFSKANQKTHEPSPTSAQEEPQEVHTIDMTPPIEKPKDTEKTLEELKVGEENSKPQSYYDQDHTLPKYDESRLEGPVHVAEDPEESERLESNGFVYTGHNEEGFPTYRLLKGDIATVAQPQIELPKEVINQIQAKRTEDYVALNENDKDIQETNNSGLVALHKMEGVSAPPDEDNDTNKKLVEGWNAIAYTAVDATFNGKYWEKTSNTLNPLYQALQSRKNFNPGTKFTISIKSKDQSSHFEKAIDQFIENAQGADGLISSGIITQQEFEALKANPNMFNEIQTIFGNDISPYIHGLDYMRDDRIVPITFTTSGDPIPNLHENFHNMVKFRELLNKLYDQGKEITGEIETVGPGSLSLRADKKYVPLKSAFKNSEVLNKKHLSIVRDPKDISFKGIRVANFKELNLASAVVALPTPNGSTFAATLRRRTLGSEGSTAIVNLLRFFTEYRGKRLTGEDLSKMEAVTQEFSKDTHNPDEFDLTSIEGIQKIVNNMVHASQKVSEYLNSETREDMKSIPILDFSLEQGGSITFSNKRDFTNIGTEERISGSDLKKLAAIGVHKQFLFIKDETGNLKPNPGNVYFFKKFEQFLLDKRMNFKAANMGIDEPYKLPYLAKDGEDWKVSDPKTIKNSGDSYWDYMTNNLETNVLEHEITNSDGSKEFAYMEQPTINIKIHGLEDVEDPFKEQNEYVQKILSASSYAEAKKIAKEQGEKFPKEITKQALKDKKDSIENSLTGDFTTEAKEALSKAFGKKKEPTSEAEALEVFNRALRDYSEFGNTVETKGTLSEIPNFNNNYTDAAKIYSELPLEIKNKIGSLQDIIQDKQDWTEKMISDWLKCK